jgi:hypothetical protein
VTLVFKHISNIVHSVDYLDRHTAVPNRRGSITEQQELLHGDEELLRVALQ